MIATSMITCSMINSFRITWSMISRITIDTTMITVAVARGA